ncbi:unnamed protein product [Thelazia callipaeda]|uniref:Fibrinogen C-terminal domain-containing protein n=1 Tax=Thelazia callipaeda TaxID=103827 RepID=A0A0N5CS33_THECL|nr:unnamed protein product [Thelazia callipaeda]
MSEVQQKQSNFSTCSLVLQAFFVMSNRASTRLLHLMFKQCCVRVTHTLLALFLSAHVRLTLFVLCSLTHVEVISALPEANVAQSQPRSFDSILCQTNIPGDCDPYSCHGTCEGRYVRFWDDELKLDRTMNSCHCVQEPVCSLIGVNTDVGCRTYTMLSKSTQRLIRLWTMNAAEKINYLQKQQLITNSGRYWERSRHKQLLDANSRFCCWTQQAKGSNVTKVNFTPTNYSLVFYLLFCAYYFCIS